MLVRRAEDRGGSEGRSLDNALDDVAINRARRQGRCEKRRAGSPCARSLRSNVHPVRHQTSYIDHIIGRSLPIHAIDPSILNGYAFNVWRDQTTEGCLFCVIFIPQKMKNAIVVSPSLAYAHAYIIAYIYIWSIDRKIREKSYFLVAKMLKIQSRGNSALWGFQVFYAYKCIYIYSTYIYYETLKCMWLNIII